MISHRSYSDLKIGQSTDGHLDFLLKPFKYENFFFFKNFYLYWSLKLTYMHLLRAICMLILTTSIYQAQAQEKGCQALLKNNNWKLQNRNFIDTTKGRGLADNYLLWDNGAIIKVKFISGSTSLREKVKKYATEWESYANVKFNFVGNEDADIRIKLTDNDGHWSFLGTQSRLYSQSAHTMNLDTTDLVTERALKGTVLHEFGHALGLLHEHESPLSGIQWNKERIYEEYKKQMGWSKSDVDNQVFSIYDVSFTNGTSYDNQSIMHYPIKSWETLNGFTVPWNRVLSTGDKNLVAALYPKNGDRVREVGRVTLTQFHSLTILDNKKKKGISVYPSFEIRSSSKSANILVAAIFLDRNGDYLYDSDNRFSYSGAAAAVREMKTLPGKTVFFNKKNKKDLELFIPYNQLEGWDSKELQAQLLLTLVTPEGQYKAVFLSKTTSFSTK
jgi:predicted Zn-dependent protease